MVGDNDALIVLQSMAKVHAPGVKKYYKCWIHCCKICALVRESLYPPFARKFRTWQYFDLNLAWSHFSSVVQSCPTLCDPMNHSMPGLPVHHQPAGPPKPMCIESVMPSSHLILCRPLLLLPSIFPNIRVFSNESALRIRWPSIGVSASTSVFPMNTQDWSPLGWTGWISLPSKGLSRVFSNTTVQKHQFFSAQLSL